MYPLGILFFLSRKDGSEKGKKNSSCREELRRYKIIWVNQRVNIDIKNDPKCCYKNYTSELIIIGLSIITFYINL